jgi:hypothetical protein
MKRALAAVILLAAAGCRDQKQPDVATVVVDPGEQTLLARQTVQLNAVARDEDGAAPAGARFTWRSLDARVATVDPAGMVTAVAPGSTGVVASYRNRADTAQIEVIAAVADCADPAARIRLGVGEAAVMRGAAAATLCLDGGADYTLVGFLGSRAPATRTVLEVRAPGAVPVSGAPSPSREPGLAEQVLVHRDDRFHARINQRAARELLPLVPEARAVLGPRREGGASRQVNAAPPQVGDIRTLNVRGDSACSSPRLRGARVMAVGSRAVVMADTTNPAGGFSDAEFRAVAAAFDTLVWPIATRNFGEPSDVDGDGRVTILYTRSVNEATPRAVNYIVGGFFYWRDLFPKRARSGFDACAGSNESEIFYLLAPDPAGVVNGNVRTRAFVFNETLGTVAHEFQHLISAGRRLYTLEVGGTEWSEELWLNEGLSHVAEELVFYRIAQLQPRGNVGAPSFATAPRVDALNRFQLQNFGRYASFLQAPAAHSVYGAVDELETRGAAWAFLRYAADRRGGDEQAFWYSLVNSRRTGLNNLGEVLGSDPIPWVRDWITSVYTDDALPTAPTLQQPSWNFRSVYGELLRPSYPLATVRLAATGSAMVPLTAGGGAYMRVGARAGQVLPVNIASGGALPPAALSVTVVRTR